jgi:HEAT repeat protein
MRTRIMKLLAAVALSISAAYAQPNGNAPGQDRDPKTFFEQLPSSQPSQALFQEALRVAEKVEKTLTKAQAQDVAPSIFAAIKDDKDGTKHALLGLYALSKRPDSGELLTPHMSKIAALLSNPDPAFKATAGHILVNMNPQPPEAADMLLAFISAPGPVNEKIDALSALAHLRNPPRDKLEAAAIQILKQPMEPRTTAAAIMSVMSPAASNALIDAAAGQLGSADWFVRLQTVLALRHTGANAVARHRGAIAKLANDPAQPEPVRTVAQNTLDGKGERCVTLQAWPTPKFEPIPGCK